MTKSIKSAYYRCSLNSKYKNQTLTPRGDCASANLYILVETAKANSLEAYHYLNYPFSRLPSAVTPEELRRVLPARAKAEDLLRLSNG